MASKKMIFTLILSSVIIATSYATKLPRSVKQEQGNNVPYVLAPSYHDKFATPIQTEESFAALLKQAQDALKGYDLDKVQQQVVHAHPKAITKPEANYKYVYAEAPATTAVKYNYVPVSYHNQADHSNDHGSYHKFGYRVHDPHSGAAFGHSEVSEGHVTRGHYHVLLPDGRLQNVKYVADHDGYHATVTYDTQKYYLV